jgi:CysZ protein
LMPLLFIASMLAIAMFAMPWMARRIGAQSYAGVPVLASANFSASFLSSLGNTLLAFAIFGGFMLLFLLSLAIMPFASPVIMVLAWALLNARVFRFDALTEHATPALRNAVIGERRWGFLALGLMASCLTYVPVLGLFVYVFVALCFIHYALDGLAQQQATRGPA